ncbi:MULTISPECIES: ATP-dependent nuclease [Enterobacterales]|uniref:ATP-dependent nuclease n=1 Tax=Enterobacterales TaxID=91347 RepID=UPI001F1D425E|nr:AAA family ATPase [Obesumbacterium proteus]HDG1710306.1 AAA family ATPase [Kluyvera ascorbata]MCE9886828.1 AAA family ATPase [Obesumbacterium proteus]MCE9916970.1 AAA family ATPase [Obesumbacterium proteus]MCE9931886.1 AAA family ATPase [Obesumbacterium proteus]MCG2877927.1 AAA family ATPase [Obesumbacterium proteus]
MYISEIRIENFRLFGSTEKAFVLTLNPGLTALVGENDAGKTAVIDAIRLVLGTRDQEFLRIDPDDFHQATPNSERTDQVVIRLTFSGLTAADRGAFSEFLTYETIGEAVETVLIITWVAKRNTKEGSSRRVLPPEWRTGAMGDGPLLDLGARSLLTATYLRPLRDAERAMSAGRGSRLSQILQHTKEIRDTGSAFDRYIDPPVDPKTLSVLGLGDYASYLFGESEGIQQARKRLNEEYLAPLSFANDKLSAEIGVAGTQEDNFRLRQLLEKLELTLTASAEADSHISRGLGSNNLLFMACELLLLAAESDGFPLLLIEEPEAHLHPQRQLRLMSFLQEQAKKERADHQRIQIIVTTHSPNLASDLHLDNIALIEGGRAFPLCKGKTKLSPSDYRFLERFLDVTKANLLFARAVMIVEGDAENILLPVLARLLDRDFHHHGVSVVNVGGLGLGRYARIFMRQDPERDGVINIPVACITDMDVMPDLAPWIVGKLEAGQPVPVMPPSKRQWRIKADFPGNALEARRINRRAKASGQKVETFVADEWTLEYDLAYHGLGKQMYRAASLALADDRLNVGTAIKADIINAADAAYEAIVDTSIDQEMLGSHVYALFESDGASKAIAAQYLAELIEKDVESGTLDSDTLLNQLPPYIVAAISHVTTPFDIAINDTVTED